MRKLTVLVAFTFSLLVADGLDYNYKFGGRVDADLNYFNIDNESLSEVQLRRARLYHRGSISDKQLFYETEIDFADELSFKDNYLGYRGEYSDLYYRIKAGNIKVPFSLDSYSSSKNSSFLESPLTDTFTENRKFGSELLLSLKNGKSRTNLFLGIFGNSVDEIRDNDDEVSRAVFKLSYGLKLGKKHLIYFGSSYLYSNFDGSSRKYKHKHQHEEIEDRLQSTKIYSVDSTGDFGVEALYINRGFHLQAEYIQSSVEAEKEWEFSGFYGQIGYFISGGSKKFKLKEGKFSRSKAKNDIELAVRYSNLNLTDRADIESSAEEINFAVNWHINRRVKLMTGFSITSPNSYRYSDSFQSIQSRLMVSF